LIDHYLQGLAFCTPLGAKQTIVNMQTVLQSIHFRKVFYLASIILIILLFIIKYAFLPIIDRRESQPKKVLRHVLDTLIAVLIAGLAIGALLFWISGNE
jgi:uncharacterized membrane protein